MAGCSLSKQQLRDLDGNTPQWRVMMVFRCLTVVVACITIAAFAICISNSSGITNTNLWAWDDKWIAYFVFVPVGLLRTSMRLSANTAADNFSRGQPALSLLQTLVTIPYLLATTYTPHPGAELTIELGIILITAFPMVFCTTVSGPLQWWRDPQSLSAPSPILAGIMELVGLVGLLILEILHLVLLVWAAQRTHSRRGVKIIRARAAAQKLEEGWGGEEKEIVCQDEVRNKNWRHLSAERGREMFENMEKGIGIAIGKDDLWVPISELRNESRLFDHGVVTVRDGEVVAVEKKLEFGIGFHGLEDNDFMSEEAEETVLRSPDPDMPPPLKVRKSVKLLKAGHSRETNNGSPLIAPAGVDQGW